MDKQEKLVQRHSSKTLLATASSSDEIPCSQSPVRQRYSKRLRSASPQRIDDSSSSPPSSDREVVPSSQSPPQPPPLPRPVRSSRLDAEQIQAMLEQSQDFEVDLGSQDMD